MHLTSEMHKLAPEAAQVLWYDSVDVSGAVNYQNGLTELNESFFTACDGLYSNYFWTEATIKASAERAGRRARDVYMGVDVYGRGTFGGGGMHCDRAAEAAREAGVSLALFAPAWTWDKHSRERYPSVEAKFWATLSRVVDARPLPRADVFTSNFDSGSGRAVWIEGRESRPEPYYDLALQQLQPTYLDVLQPGGGMVSRFTDAAFNGGSCLLVEAAALPPGGAYVKLFNCDLKIGGTGRAFVSVVFAELQDGGAGFFDVKLALQASSAFWRCNNVGVNAPLRMCVSADRASLPPPKNKTVLNLRSTKTPLGPSLRPQGRAALQAARGKMWRMKRRRMGRKWSSRRTSPRTSPGPPRARSRAATPTAASLASATF